MAFLQKNIIPVHTHSLVLEFSYSPFLNIIRKYRAKKIKANVRIAHKVFDNIFLFRQVLSEFQYDDLKFDLAQEPSLMKQFGPLSILVEITALLMSIHIYLKFL